MLRRLVPLLFHSSLLTTPRTFITNSAGGTIMTTAILKDEPSHAAAMAMPEYLLEAEGITKRYPGVIALNGVGLKIRPGTVHALMGENGAGKSTLMKIIAGVYQPDKGEIKLKGKPVKLTTPLAA